MSVIGRHFKLPFVVLSAVWAMCCTDCCFNHLLDLVQRATGKCRPFRQHSGWQALLLGSRIQLADGPESLLCRFQRLVDIGGTMRRGQEHVVLGMEEGAVA